MLTATVQTCRNDCRYFLVLMYSLQPSAETASALNAALVSPGVASVLCSAVGRFQLHTQYYLYWKLEFTIRVF